MKLAVITSAPTFTSGKKKYSAYAPYVKEMNIWFRFVEDIILVSPGTFPDKVFTEPFESKNIQLKKIPFLDFQNWSSSLKGFLNFPKVVFAVYYAMKRADHIHLRCPGNIGLIATVIQILFPKKAKSTKYAGNWDPNADQPLSYKIQKWIISNTFLTRRMKVLVYGTWPNQSRNILPFQTASFSEVDIDLVNVKLIKPPYRFLFVGNLVPGKQVDIAVRLIKRLKEKDVPVLLDVFGGGREYENLMKYCKAEEIEDIINFKGHCSLTILKKAYQKAHFLILPSKSEGWPKAVAEAMFFGCIPIATPVSCIPWILGEGERGLILSGVEKGSAEEIEFSIEKNAQLIQDLLLDERKINNMSSAAKKWSQNYTLEKFEVEIRNILESE